MGKKKNRIQNQKQELKSLLAFLNNVDDMVYFQDLDGSVSYLNVAHTKITGYSKEEFETISDLWRKIIDPEHFIRNQNIFLENPEGMHFYETEYRLKTKEGVWRWIQSRMFGLKDSSGQYIGYTCIDRDITNLKRFEGVLRELISFRESLIDSAMVLFHVLDDENNVIMWNQGAQDITGYKREEAIGNPHIWEWMYPDKNYRKSVLESYSKVSKKGKILKNFETTIQTKNCGKKTILWFARKIQNEVGLSHEMVALGHDITKRKETEKKLKLLQSNLQIEKYKLEQVLDISHQISSILELNHLIDFIPDVAMNLLEAQRCSLMIMDSTTKELRIVSSKGLDKRFLSNTVIKYGEPIAGIVAKSGEPLLVKDLEIDSQFKRQKRSTYKSTSFIIVPIKLQNKVVGVVNVADKNIDLNPVFNEIDLKILTMIVQQAAISIENAYHYKEKERLSNTDPMTGLFNHRYFIQHLDEEIRRADRKHHPLSLMMIDIDNFKNYNDQYGHLEGDILLQSISKCIEENIRSIDVPCRYAGDEFVVILPETDRFQTLTVANRVRNSVNKLALKNSVTVSIGISEREDNEETNEVILKADQALYLSKRAGKNSVRSVPE